MIKKIVIKGAKEHNLKNISVEIPKDQFVVITGLSGSGNHLLHLIQFMLKGKDVMLKVCQLMLVNF
jgi:excinuclease UvrABC ATPase subunit